MPGKTGANRRHTLKTTDRKEGVARIEVVLNKPGQRKIKWLAWFLQEREKRTEFSAYGMTESPIFLCGSLFENKKLRRIQP